MTGDRQARRQTEHEARDAAQDAVDIASLAEILSALVHGCCLAAAVPLALAQVERDPLMRVALFEGDLMRGLMEVPGAFWGRHPQLYDHYRQALRRSADLRRRLPVEERMCFWSPLTRGHVQEILAVTGAQGTTRALPRDD
jgi:hypothetical protein